MRWEVKWTEQALKDASRLDQQIRERVLNALDRLADGSSVDVKKLVGEGDELRLRVGDWCVRFQFHHSSGVIEVLRVLHRSRVYRE